MGTRCLTKVYDDGAEVITMYRQFDGYLEGHGQELADFLRDFRIVNGITMEDAGSKQPVANGMGCLAAQIVAHFKAAHLLGGFYLYPQGSTDCGEEYIYHVTLEDNMLHLRVTDVYKKEDIFSDFVHKFKEKEVSK